MRGNLEIIRATYEGPSEENGKHLLAALAADATWTEAAGFRYAGSYVGAEAIVANVFRRLATEWIDYRALHARLEGSGEWRGEVGEFGPVRKYRSASTGAGPRWRIDRKDGPTRTGVDRRWTKRSRLGRRGPRWSQRRASGASQGHVPDSSGPESGRCHRSALQLEEQRLAAWLPGFPSPRSHRAGRSTNHRELGAAYWILDAAQKYATGRWESPKTRDTFVAAVRETLALTVEQGIELPESAREGARSAVAPNGLQRPAARTRE